MNTHKDWTKHLLTQEHTQACTHINTGNSWMASVQTACHKISCTDSVRAPWPRRYSLSLTVFLLSLSFILSYCFFSPWFASVILLLNKWETAKESNSFHIIFQNLRWRLLLLLLRLRISPQVHFQCTRLLNHLFVTCTTSDKRLMHLTAAIHN